LGGLDDLIVEEFAIGIFLTGYALTPRPQPAELRDISVSEPAERRSNGRRAEGPDGAATENALRDSMVFYRAAEGIRTLDPELGKVVLI